MRLKTKSALSNPMWEKSQVIPDFNTNRGDIVEANYFRSAGPSPPLQSGKPISGSDA